MIIDFHTHIAYHGNYSQRFVNKLFNLENIQEEKQKNNFSKLIKLFLNDSSCNRMLKQMDKANIAKSVLLIVDDNGFLGKRSEKLADIYEKHANILKKNEDRFIVFGGYHPHRDEGMDLLKRGVEEYGFSGIKLYPPFGFQLNDPGMDACYRYANDNKLPILSHTGFSVSGLDNDYANPEDFFKVADQLTDCPVILAHAGYKLHEPVVQELLQKDNFYADISGFQTADEEFTKLIFESKFNNKILFGTDWPIPNMMKSLSELVNQVHSIFSETEGVSEQALENIFWNNANRVLGL